MKNKSTIVERIHTFEFTSKKFLVKDYCINPSLHDDDAYMDHNVWKQLPRGKSEVYHDNVLIYTLVGSKKFGDENHTYGLNGNIWNNEWDQVFATIKENGECFHVGFFKYDNVKYCVIGSKNVHILLDLTDLSSINDQLNFVDNIRYSYAIKMAKCFFKNFTFDIFDFCIKNNVCFVGEYINPEHYHVCSYEKEEIKFFAITSVLSEYTWCTPDEMVKICKEIGVKAVDIFACQNNSELDIIKDEYFHKPNMEGLVLYFVKDQRVVRIQKFKNKEYTILRTIREYINNGSSHLKLKDRLNEYHIHLKQSEISEWINFFLWVKQNKPEQFGYNIYANYLNSDKKLMDTDKTIVMLCGLPGSGKTTVGSNLMYGLLEKSISSIYLDQDMFNRDGKRFDAAVLDYIKNDSNKVIILGKSNTTKQMRTNTLKHVTTEKIICVNFEPPKDLEQLSIRINGREYHKNLFYPMCEKVIKDFSSTYQPPLSEDFQNLINVTFGESIDQVLGKICKFLDKDISICWNNFVMCEYIGVKVNQNDIKKIIDESCEKYTIEKKIHIPATRSYHVTLLYWTNFCDFKKLQKWWHRIGETIEIQIKGLLWNDDISMFEVWIETEQFHITWEKKNQTIQNKDSKKLFELSDVNKIGLDYKIEGIISKY